MKKIAFIHYAYPPTIGGVEVLMQEHAEVLTQLGYEVTILTGSGNSENKAIKVIEIPELQSLKNINPELQLEIDNNKVPDMYHEFVQKLEQTLDSYLADQEVIIVHNMLTVKRNLPFIEAFTKFHAKHPEKKVIGYSHDHNYILEEQFNYPENPIELEQRLLTTSLPNVQYVTISKTFARLLAQVIQLPEEKIITIPNGINIMRFLEIDPIIQEFIKKYTILEKMPIIISPVNIVERKNLEYSVQVVGALKKYYPNLCYIITGQTSKHKDTSGYFEKIQKLIEEQDIKENTLYFSYLYQRYLHDKEMHDLYSIADVVFYFSKSENFGLPLLEAGLSRTPIFTSNLDVFNEVQGKSPFTIDYEKESPEEVAEKVHQYLSNDTVTQLNYRIRNTYELEKIIKTYLLPLF